MIRPHFRSTLLWVAAVAGGYTARVGLRPPGSALASGTPESPAGAVSGEAKAGAPATGPGGLNPDPLAKAGLEEMRRFFAEYDAIAAPPERLRAMRRLMARWVDLNPRDALDFAVSRNSREETRRVLTQWALADPKALAAYLQDPANHPPIVPMELLGCLISNGGEKAALPLIRALEEKEPLGNFLDFQLLRDLLGRTALVDFEGTMELYRRLPDYPSYGNWQLLEQIAGSRALSDPDEALRWARGLEKDSGKAVGAVLGQMARRDPARAAAEFKNTPGLSPPIIPENAGEGLLEKIAAGLSRSDPAAAFRWVEEVTKGREDAPKALQAAALGMLNQALREPERLADLFPLVREHLDAGELYGIRPPAGKLGPIFEALSALPAGTTRDRILANLAIQEGDRDPMTALSWMQSVEDPQARKDYARRLSIPMGPEASAQARELYEALPADLKSVAAGRLAETQAVENAPGAAAWARSLTDPAAMTLAMRSALASWTSTASAEASAWADALPPGAARDAAAAGIALGIADREPSSAFIWAGSIIDPAQRAEAEKTALSQWRRRDPAAAAAAVQAASMPEERRAELQNFLHSKKEWYPGLK